MQTYDIYKDSGIDWLGEIPSHWDLHKLKHIFKEKRKVLNFDLPAGAISFGNVVYKDDEKIPESTKATYQEVLSGEYLINPLNLNYDLISLRIALSDKNVVVSSGYIVIQNIIDLNKSFYKWLLHQYDVSYMKLLGSGVRQTISFNHISDSLLPIPPIHEQEAIAAFLDEKCGKIDALVEIKSQQIEKLKELRQVKIHQAVTKGLEANVELKDSGIDWIGEIPKHWEVSKLGNILKPYSVKNKAHLPLLSITREKGVILRGEDPEEANHNFIPDDLSGYKHIKKGQFGMNKMKAWQGSYGYSQFEGIVSPAYYIFDISDKLFGEYFSKTIRSNAFIPFFIQASDGVRIGQWDLSKPRMKEIPFFIPPVHEQEQIVTYLDEVTGKIDQAIAQKQEQIEKLKQYKQSLINEVVTGKVKVA